MNVFFTQLMSSLRKTTFNRRFFVATTVLAFLLVGVGKVGRGQNPTNGGFEVNGSVTTTPTSWTVTGTTTTTNARTGSYALVSNSSTSTSNTAHTNSSTISIPANNYGIVIAWARGSNSFSNASAGGTLGVTTSSTTTANIGTTLTRLTYVTALNGASTQNFSCRVSSRSSTSGQATQVYFDDVIMYASTTNTPDLTKPTSPSSFTSGTINSGSVGFTWTNGTDAGTGNQATIILRTTNLSAATPVLNDQGVYSVTGGTSGPNTVSTDWTVISVTVGSGATTFTDNTVSASTSYRYAVIHRDLAYNYSNALVSGTITTTSAGGSTPPTLTAAGGATVDAPFNVTFTDDATWRGAITSITVDGTPLTAGFNTTTAGQITFTPSASVPAGLLQTAGANKSIVIAATGYTNATVSQTIGVGAANKLAMVTQPAAPATNGAVLATQPTVRVQDQYNNNVTTSTAAITATVGAGTWTIGGTNPQNAVNGTGIATFTNLTALSLSAVTGATIQFTSPGLTSVTSNTFNIPAPAPPTLTAAAGATVDAPFVITFTDNSSWRSAISSITVGGTTLTGGYTVSAGQITFTPSASAPANLLQSSGTKTIVVIASGYTNTSVSQTIGAGVATNIAVTTQPLAPSVNGGALATQPVLTIRDQYNNTVTGSSAAVVATVGAGSWTLGGTTSINASSGVATFSGLIATAATAVMGATITFTSGVFSVTSNSFNIPGPALGTYLFTAGSLAATGVASNVSFANVSNPNITLRNNNDIWSGFPSTGNWGAAFNSNLYLEFTVTASGGYVFTATDLIMDVFRTGAGASNYSVRSSIDNFGADIATGTVPGTQTAISNISLSSLSYSGLSSVTFRVYGWGGGSTGDFRVDNIFLSGTVQSVPEINVKQGVTNILSSTGSYSFGTIVIGNSSSAITFTVENTGSATLSLSGTPRVAISGHTSDFTIDQTATTASVSAAGSTTFTVTFNPTTTGTRTATISIANNDGNENPYTFTVTGIGNSPTAPEINLRQGVTNIASGGSYAFGSQAAATSSAAVTFTIENTGNADLTLSGTPRVAISGTNAAEFTVDQTATTSPVGAASSTTFTITFSPTSTGAKSATITIANDDVDEGTYTFTLSGTGALATEPTAAPTALVFSSVTNVGFNVSFTAASGSPTGYLVLRRSGTTAPSGTPVDGITYSVGQNNINSGTNTVAYVGPFPSPNFLENALAADTRYNYVVYSYNGSGAGINYYTAASLSGNRYTLATEPTSQGSPSVTNIQPTSMQLTGFNSGGGDNVIIIAKQGSAVNALPIDGVNYTASASFGTGGPSTSLGGGNFVVGINPSDPLTVTGLTPGLTYHFAAFDYNGTLANLSANFLTTNPGTANGTTPSNTSDIVVVGGSEASTISSLTNIATISTSSEGTQVWQFTIRDGGGTSDADNLPTIVNTLVFTQNTGNQMDNFLNAIQSIALFNGSTLISNTPTITATQISFSGLGLEVPDGGSLTITVRMSVKSNVNAGSSTGVNADGDDFVFQLTAGNQVTGSTTTSSQFVSTFSPVVASANGSNVYSVVATRLAFAQQPPTEVNLNTAMSPAVTVSAEDIGGNRDVNYTTSVAVTSTGVLAGSPISATPVAGLATFNTLTHTSLGSSLTLTANSGSFAPVASNSFNVTSGPTALAPGDVVVLAMGTNIPDKFAVLLLKEINAGTAIHFTDNSFASTTTPNTNEGFLTFTAPSRLCAGTVISWTNGQLITGTGWSSASPPSFAFTNSGDQLFVFQGSTANWGTQSGITLLYGVYTNGSMIASGSSSTALSYSPASLDDVYEVEFTGASENDVYFASSSITGIVSSILTSVTNPSNYTRQNTTFSMPSYSAVIYSTVTDRAVNRYVAITPIVITLESGATGATVSGLPAGLTSSVASGVLTIKGAATQSGNFPYTATATGSGCPLSYGGTISVTAAGPFTGPLRTRANGDFTNASTWEFFNGDEWQVAATSPEYPAGINNLTIRHTLSFNTDYTVGGSNTVEITGSGTVTIPSGVTVDFNGSPVTLQSNASGTAAIGQISGTLTGATNVTAERYIPGKRAWRAISVPLRTASGNAFIWDQWQNGGTQTTGVGALIWKPGGTFIAGDGYSAGGVSPNLLAYTNGAFTAPASTKTAVLFNTNGPVPYMLFATDYFRSASGSGAITNGASATTLRANGTLYTGNYNTGTLSSGYHLIPNPYPSPITLSSVLLGSVNDQYVVWDSRLAGNNGYGGYAYFSNGVSSTAGLTSRVIPAGSAFWVLSNGSGSISMTEATKGGTSFNVFSRTTGNPGVLRLNLANTAGDQLYDGVAVAFESNTSAGLDAQDAVKFSLGTDNLSIRRSGKDLAIEFRPPATSADTIFLQLHNLKQAAYRFEFSSENLSGATGATALLKDRYLGTETPLQLGSGQQIGFQVDGNAASAGNRFYIVFRAGTVTPVVDLNGARGFAVYPNPVPAGSPLQVEIRNRVAGTYQFVLYSSTGVQVAQRVVQHGGGTAVQSVQLPQQLPAGMYIAEFTDAKGGKQQLKINIQ